jgi:DNA-binding NarL/FixJ family response regulator
MRTLTDSALKAECGIPREWLKNVYRGASYYAKQLSTFTLDNNQTAGIKALSPRESEILRNLYYGLSRPEVASKLGLSVNTINTALIKIYGKLNTNKIADAIRVAVEHKMI